MIDHCLQPLGGQIQLFSPQIIDKEIHPLSIQRRMVHEHAQHTSFVHGVIIGSGNKGQTRKKGAKRSQNSEELAVGLVPHTALIMMLLPGTQFFVPTLEPFIQHFPVGLIVPEPVGGLHTNVVFHEGMEERSYDRDDNGQIKVHGGHGERRKGRGHAAPVTMVKDAVGNLFIGRWIRKKNGLDKQWGPFPFTGAVHSFENAAFFPRVGINFLVKKPSESYGLFGFIL